MKKAAVFMVAAIMALIMTACDQPGDSAESDPVVATVNGESIYKSEWEEIYSNYKQMLSIYSGIDASTESGKETLEEYKTIALEALIRAKVIRQQADSMGLLDFTEEERAQAEENVRETIQTQIQSYADELKASLPEQSEEECYAQAQQAYERDMADKGESIESRVQLLLEQQANDELYDVIAQAAIPSEEDIQAEYNRLLEEQRKLYDEDTNQFFNDYDAGEVLLVYVPYDYVKMQHILISYPSEQLEEIQSLYMDIYELEADLAEEEDAEKRSELEEKQAELDTLMQEGASLIQEETDDLYQQALEADRDEFIQMVINYTDDTGQNTKQACELGYLVGEGDFIDEDIRQAALSLADGQIAEPILTVNGYHIVRRDSVLEAGEISLEEVREKLTEQLTSQRQTDAWEDSAEQWIEAAEIERFDDIYKLDT
mgnify:FL=1